MSLRSFAPWMLMLALAGCRQGTEPVFPFTETLPLEFALLDPLILVPKVDAGEWRGGSVPSHPPDTELTDLGRAMGVNERIGLLPVGNANAIVIRKSEGLSWVIKGPKLSLVEFESWQNVNLEPVISSAIADATPTDKPPLTWNLASDNLLIFAAHLSFSKDAPNASEIPLKAGEYVITQKQFTSPDGAFKGYVYEFNPVVSE